MLRAAGVVIYQNKIISHVTTKNFDLTVQNAREINVGQAEVDYL